MKTLIKEIVGINGEGVSFNLTEKASLNGNLSTKHWFVSWDKIGKALFKEQYYDGISLKALDQLRGNTKIKLAE